MKVAITTIQELLQSAAQKFVSTDEADYFARLYMDTHLRKSPRMNPLADAVSDLKNWSEMEGSALKRDVDKESVLILDFDGLAPALKIKLIHDEIVARAAKNGIAVVGYRNSAAVITLNPWSYGLAQRDLLGIAMFNGGTQCNVPYGGTRGLFGTLPMAYAIPSATEPIELDMATTEIPFFQIKNAKDQGVSLPEGAAVDRHGRPTTDAAAALGDDGVANLLPLGGGFKGYGLTLLLEILTGSLVRSLLSTQQTPGWNPPDYGGIIIGFDISSFTQLDDFKRDVSDMCHQIREQPPAEGVKQIPIPGDRERLKVSAALAEGAVEVSDPLLADLRGLA
jgi:ureidoglycolate dehydrogenase (NAD+)